MPNRANIKLPRDDYQRHNERRKALGLSWSEYIDSQAPELPSPDVQIDYEEIEARVRDAVADELREV